MEIKRVRLTTFRERTRRLVHRRGPHRPAVPATRPGTCGRCQRHVRARGPDGVAHPSAGADPDHHGRLRLGPARRRPGRGSPSRRRGLVPAWREALARRLADHGHDAYRHPGTARRQGRRLAGTRAATNSTASDSSPWTTPFRDRAKFSKVPPLFCRQPRLTCLAIGRMIPAPSGLAWRLTGGSSCTERADKTERRSSHGHLSGMGRCRVGRRSGCPARGTQCGADFLHRQDGRNRRCGLARLSHEPAQTRHPPGRCNRLDSAQKDEQDPDRADDQEHRRHHPASPARDRGIGSARDDSGPPEPQVRHPGRLEWR